MKQLLIILMLTVTAIVCFSQVLKKHRTLTLKDVTDCERHVYKDTFPMSSTVYSDDIPMLTPRTNTDTIEILYPKISYVKKDYKGLTGSILVDSNLIKNYPIASFYGNVQQSAFLQISHHGTLSGRLKSNTDTLEIISDYIRYIKIDGKVFEIVRTKNVTLEEAHPYYTTPTKQ